MNTYYLYYNQHRNIVSAKSFDMVCLGWKHWLMPGTILFIEDVKTKEIKKYIVEQMKTAFDWRKNMKKWLNKQVSAFVLGFLDNLKEYRSTPDNVLDALNIVTEFIGNKYWR